MAAPVMQCFVELMEGDNPTPLIDMLERGVDAELTRDKEYFLLHMAAQLGRVRCVEYMLSRGAEVEIGIAGFWPIHRAAQSNSGATISLLIDHGADPTFHPSYDCSPLMIASACGCLEAVRTLLLYYTLADLRAVTKEGCSAVFLAIRGAHVDVLQDLLLQGALLPRGDEKVLPRWIYGSEVHKPVLSVIQKWQSFLSCFGALTAARHNLDTLAIRRPSTFSLYRAFARRCTLHPPPLQPPLQLDLSLSQALTPEAKASRESRLDEERSAMLCHVLFDLSHDLFAEILFGLGLGRYHVEDTPDLGRILWSSQNFFSTPVRMCLEIIEVNRAEPRVEETRWRYYATG